MNVLQKLFSRKTEQPQGIMLEIQSGFTAFSGTAYGSAAFRGQWTPLHATRQSCKPIPAMHSLNACCRKVPTPI